MGSNRLASTCCWMGVTIVPPAFPKLGPGSWWESRHTYMSGWACSFHQSGLVYICWMYCQQCFDCGSIVTFLTAKLKKKKKLKTWGIVNFYPVFIFYVIYLLIFKVYIKAESISLCASLRVHGALCSVTSISHIWTCECPGGSKLDF